MKPPIDVERVTFLVMTALSPQLRDMSTDKIRARGPTDLNVTFSKRKFKDQKIYTFTSL